jgi:hypothetical protein
MSLRRWLSIALLLISRAVVVQAQVFAAESSFAQSTAARDVQAFASFVAPEAWRVVFDKGCPVCAQTPALVGSWRLVSAKSGGRTIEFPPGMTILKHVTPTHFVWVHYDRNGQITQAGGGSYVVSGERYDETPEYGLGEGIQPLLGKRQSFTVRIAENRWYQGGKETTGDVIEEIWERM